MGVLHDWIAEIYEDMAEERHMLWLENEILTGELKGFWLVKEIVHVVLTQEHTHTEE